MDCLRLIEVPEPFFKPLNVRRASSLLRTCYRVDWDVFEETRSQELDKYPAPWQNVNERFIIPQNGQIFLHTLILLIHYIIDTSGSPERALIRRQSLLAITAQDWDMVDLARSRVRWACQTYICYWTIVSGSVVDSFLFFSAGLWTEQQPAKKEREQFSPLRAKQANIIRMAF